MALPEADLPQDLVLVGHVAGAYGLQGWVRIRPYSPDATAMLSARTWWLDKSGWQDMQVRQAKTHGDDVVASVTGVADRDQAEALKGSAVYIRRAHFPALDEGEYYWVDLIGLTVVNDAGLVLGQVSGLMDNGAHPILQVTPAADPGDSKAKELLIPFVEQFVHTVDQAQGRITVDWELDY